MEVAALIHDVGKIGVPDSILRKPGQLTDARVCGDPAAPDYGRGDRRSRCPALRAHWTRSVTTTSAGTASGYPGGLAGEAIPFVARLMAVADSYSAMTTDRPYRKGMPQEKALGILRDGAGVQWDPQCVAAFLEARGAVPALVGG